MKHNLATCALAAAILIVGLAVMRGIGHGGERASYDHAGRSGR